MKVLITGAKGFIGRNLTAELEHSESGHVLHPVDVDTTAEQLDAAIAQYHGRNRRFGGA